jgi:hypothetical protein
MGDGMASFDFVTDEDLRASLEADAAEMAACLDAKAFKATVVLAGSIVEAVLVDHLESTGYQDPNGKNLLELDLGHLIMAARSQKVLSAKSADLSSAVKTYRNLIHPGRLVRQKERIDASTAAIAGHLVEVVASEVADLKRDTYGYTAQQIVSKVENDSSSMAILGDLLKNTNGKELERLLVRDLPARYMELAPLEEDSDEQYSPILSRLRRAYRSAFEAVSEDTMKRFVKNYARILREEVSEYQVLTHEQALFRAEDLEYMTDDDRAMAMRHLLSQVGRDLPDHLRDSLIGIGKFADALELAALVDAFVRYTSTSKYPARRRTAGELLRRLYAETPSGTGEAIIRRLQDWERTVEERTPELAKWIGEQRSSLVNWFDGLPS